MTRGDARGAVLVGVAAAMWGTWSLFLRPADLSSLASTALVFATMGLCGLPIALRELASVRPGALREALPLLLLMAGCSAGNVLAYFAALTRTTVAIAVLTHYLAPILVALSAPWIDGERPAGARFAALTAGLGLLLVLAPWSEAADGSTWLGAGLGAASAVFFGGTMFVSRRLGARIGACSTITLHSLIVAAVLVPLVAGDLAEVSWRAGGLVVLGGIFPGALAGILFVTGLGLIGASRAAVLAYLEPMVAVAVGALVWHEPVGPLAAVGALFIIASGVAVARQPPGLRPARVAIAPVPAPSAPPG